MRLSRRRLLGGAAAAALGGAGVYELVDQLSSSPHRTVEEAAARPAEQHLIDLGTVQSEGVEVVVPPLHSEVLTATLKAPNLHEAQRELEAALQELDSLYAPNPAGLAVTVAWGLPYFEGHVAAQAKLHLPHDRRANKPALLPTRSFPSDPKATLLEHNDVAVLLRSDHRAHIDAARKALFHDLSIFHLTSIRRGFAGGGFHGGQSLPKRLAVAAGVAGADLIPDTSELFLGFTSTQKAGLGPGLIANHETLGYVDVGSGYFRNGTHMHLSHLTEDLEAWYLNFDFDERVLTAFRPGHDGRPSRNADRPAGAEERLVGTRAQEPVRGRPAASGTALRSRRPRGSCATRSPSTGPSTRRGPRFPSAPTSTRSTTRSPGRPIRSATQWSEHADRRSALRRVQPVERRFRAQPAGDGRRAAGRHEAVRAAEHARAGLQLDPHHHAPPELPRAPPAAPLVSACRALTPAPRSRRS